MFPLAADRLLGVYPLPDQSSLSVEVKDSESEESKSDSSSLDPFLDLELSFFSIFELFPCESVLIITVSSIPVPLLEPYFFLPTGLMLLLIDLSGGGFWVGIMFLKMIRVLLT